MAVEVGWTHYRAKIASLSRDRDPDDPELIEARRNLKALRLQDRIASDLHSQPALTVEQRAELAAPLVSVLAAPDELTCRRLLALLNNGHAGNETTGGGDHAPAA
jgi:hypothetical protein